MENTGVGRAPQRRLTSGASLKRDARGDNLSTTGIGGRGPRGWSVPRSPTAIRPPLHVVKPGSGGRQVTTSVSGSTGAGVRTDSRPTGFLRPVL